jgi:hypothetical protein
MGLLTGLMIAGIGSQVVGGILQNRAAGKASAQQQQAAREALAVQQQQYAQTRQDLGPYRQQGGVGLSALSSLLGLPAPGPEAPPVPLASTAPPAAPSLANTGAPSRAIPLPGGMAGGTGVPSRAVPIPGGGPGTPGPGGQVLLRAPSGQTKLVPFEHVDYYLARGATRG